MAHEKDPKSDTTGREQITRRDLVQAVGAAGAAASLAGYTGKNVESNEAQQQTVELLTTYTSPASKDSYNAANEAFREEHPDLEPQMGFTDWNSIFDRLINAARTGNWPDLEFFVDNHWNALLYGEDLVEDPQRLMDAATEVAGPIDDSVPETHYLTKDGAYYTMESNNQSEVFWYRTDALEEVDEDPPETWEDEARAVEKMDDADNDLWGTAISTAKDVYTDNIFLARLHGAGGLMVDPEQNPVLDSEYTRDLLEHWKKLGEHAPPGSENWSFGPVYTNFATKKTASCYYWGRTLINVVEQSPDVQDQVNCVHFPIPDTDAARPNNLSFMSGDGGQIPKGAENKEGAVEWWKNYIQPEFFVDIFMQGTPGNTVPIHEDHVEPWEEFDIWTEVEHGEEIRDTLFEDTRKAHPAPRETPDHSLFPPSGNFLGQNIISGPASNYWAGDISADDAATEMQKRAEQELS